MIDGLRADARWPWAEDIARSNTEAHLSLALLQETSQRLEALLYVSDEGRERSRFDRSSPLLYIERIVVAPWNHGEFRRAQGMKPEKSEFAGLGPFLLSVVVGLSDELGYGGRFGLHSEDDALKWYRDILHLPEFGPDPYEGRKWLYFEGDLDWVAGWRARQGERK